MVYNSLILLSKLLPVYSAIARVPVFWDGISEAKARDDSVEEGVEP